VVVWVFAGGGYTEFGGLILFLERNFSQHFFTRKTPVRPRPGPNPKSDRRYHVYGQSGGDLAMQISYFLVHSNPRDECDAILIIDDLDCQDRDERYEMFQSAVEEVEAFAEKDRVIGFAKPEIEAWLVADWESTFAKYEDWRAHQVRIRRELSRAYQELTEDGDIDNPENFSHYDEGKNACHDKLSDVIIRIILDEADIHYSKATHSSLLLRDTRSEIVAARCPVFRDLYRQLDGLSNKGENQ